MATGMVAGQGDAGRRRNLLILEAATATNSPPSGASAGTAWSATDITDYFGAKYEAPSATVEVYSSAGSATMTVTVKLWGYDSVSAKWFDLGTLNSGNAIAELSADSIRWAEKVDDLFDWDRIYAEITAIGGTSTAINVVVRLPMLLLN